jgi:hypothetical protein
MVDDNCSGRQREWHARDLDARKIKQKKCVAAVAQCPDGDSPEWEAVEEHQQMDQLYDDDRASQDLSSEYGVLLREFGSIIKSAS